MADRHYDSSDGEFVDFDTLADWESRDKEKDARIAELEAALKWIHDGAHTRGHTLPDIKEAAHIALYGGKKDE